MADDPDIKQQREEFAAARRILVDKIVAGNPGLTHTDFDGVAVSDLDNHAATLASQQAQRDLEAAARALGKTVDEVKAMQEAATTTTQETTPQERTANLPQGKPPMIPTPAAPAAATAEDGSPLWGGDLIAAAAAEDIAVWRSTGKWPRSAND